MAADKGLLRKLPKVDDVLKAAGVLVENYPRRYVLDAIRSTIEARRADILSGNTVKLSVDAILPEVEAKVEAMWALSLRPLINATGIVIHTNLGRSPLSEAAIDNVVRAAAGIRTSNTSLSAASAASATATSPACFETTGAEDGIAVNNNAAAVLVCLSALARGREVVVSRGELVEIGGSFRIPDVMAQSGAILREVGSTNKTHLRDYERAINENTALILKVHQSNYRITGFTSEVSIAELAELGARNGIPVMHDLGSGSLIELASHGMPGEPSVREVVKSGPGYSDIQRGQAPWAGRRPG